MLTSRIQPTAAAAAADKRLLLGVSPKTQEGGGTEKTWGKWGSAEPKIVGGVYV